MQRGLGTRFHRGLGGSPDRFADTVMSVRPRFGSAAILPGD